MGTSKRYADSIDRRAELRGDHPRSRPSPPTASSGTGVQPPDDPRARLRTEPPPAPPADRPAPVRGPVREWTPPWPPIRIGESEWIVMRDSAREPVAVIRVVTMGPRKESFYRVVTWAPTSDARRLVGYYRTLEEADRAVLFAPTTVSP